MTVGSVGTQTGKVQPNIPLGDPVPSKTMFHQRSFLLFICMMLAVHTHLSEAQHWSHGWYPGGKREIDVPQSPEIQVPEDITLCDGEDCTSLKVPRDKMVKNLLADMIARELQKKK